MEDVFFWFIAFLVVGLVVLGLMAALSGLVVIGERQVGIVVKKFSSRNLPPGKLIALHGEGDACNKTSQIR